jgi:hypothetical protein
MAWIIIETSGGLENAIFIKGGDGKNRVFYSEEEASDEANEYEDAYIVLIEKDLAAIEYDPNNL